MTTGLEPIRAADLVEMIDLDAVLRGQGLDPDMVRARTPGLVGAASRALDCAASLIEPRAACAIHDVRGIDREGVRLSGGVTLSGPSVPDAVASAEQIAAVVCTIGGRLEHEAAARFDEDPLLAMGLDGVGNAAMLALASQVCHLLEQEASLTMRTTGSPLSPGTGGWRLETGQKEIFQLVDGIAAGVELFAGSVMRPVKSTSMIVGIGASMPRHAALCERCDRHDRCRYAGRDVPDVQRGGLHMGRSECDRH